MLRAFSQRGDHDHRSINDIASAQLPRCDVNDSPNVILVFCLFAQSPEVTYFSLPRENCYDEAPGRHLHESSVFGPAESIASWFQCTRFPFVEDAEYPTVPKT